MDASSAARVTRERPDIAAILDGLERGADGIYSAPLPDGAAQHDEIRERRAVAARADRDALGEVSDHHSIPVMDRELTRFLRDVPRNGVVVDVGSGWGWHWRRLAATRPDVCVVLVDLVRENLAVAARLLDSLADRVFLVHGDATRMPFPSAVFHGYWSVQALQHVPAFEQAVREAARVLRPSALFACYVLNRAPLVEMVYRLAGRTYHVHGPRPGSFYLARGTAAQAAVVARAFGAPVATRFSELLFHPDLRLRTGRASSWAGAIDARLSSGFPLFAWFARQRSYHVRTPA